MPSPHFTQPVCLCRQAIEKNSLLAPEGICLPLNRGINQLVRPRTPRRVPPTNQQRSFSSFRSSDLTAMTDPNNNWAGEDPTTVFPRRKKGRQRIAPVALKLKSLRRLSGRLYLNRTTLRPKPAFSSLDRVFLVPVAESWAVRPGHAVSVALAGSVGFQACAP